MRRLLITGGSGYLGAELVRQAILQGRWVTTATTFSQRLHQRGVDYRTVDIVDQSAIERLFDDVQPEVVIHTAYRQNEPGLWDVTADGAQHIAQATQRIGARLIHLSSDALFDGEKDGSYTDRDSPNPITAYGIAKANAERLVAAAHPDALIVRTSLIYGGRQQQGSGIGDRGLGTIQERRSDETNGNPGVSVHERLILEAANGLTDIAFFTDEIRCPIQVSDLARALLELTMMDQRGVLHVAGADAVSRYTFACLVAAAYGHSPTVLRAALSGSFGARRPRNCAMNSAPAQQLLQTRLRGVHEVLGQPHTT
jgi:dTDP-4-dehydrorhamnose reductase